MTTATTAPAGLMFQVVRPTPSTYGDLTCGGVSGEASHLTVVGIVDDDGDCQPLPKTAQVFPARPDAPAVVVDRTYGGWPILVPAYFDAQAGQWERLPSHTMAGGNFAASSDSRATDALCAVLGERFYGAVAIHDRIEQ
ncbi:MAG: hypothetical protein DI630_16470 [Gordonia sp. (in: high G+C Gram-positive bacteria)]|nr:MAG: hypothetical protein DI630_16470 [Gordonia sp. (in: high G+C Gram-positive bacteria)]